MDSFYGGRQGASFIIVRRFDGVNIPQIEGSYVYRTGEYAVSSTGDFLYPLIEKNATNYKDHSWKIHAKDGSAISAASANKFPLELAEGMVQCFEQGGETTSIVNYGEYVLIDTIENMQEHNSPDNGKVYRRGFNYDYNELSNPTAGGEYIGQIVGPQGECTEIEMADIDEISSHPHYQEDFYNINNGIKPGSWINSLGQREYLDDITYAWVTLKDNYGTVKGCMMGFSFPYLVTNFIANSADAYYNRSSSSAGFTNLDLVTRVDNAEHPYFSEWKIAVPKGIKGDCSTNLEIVNTCAKPSSKYYGDESLSVLRGNLPSSGEFALRMDLYKLNTAFAALEYNDTMVYVAKEDTFKTRMRYKQTNYDRVAEGDIEYIDLGEYNTIQSVGLSDEGILSVRYSYSESIELEEAIRWIYIEKENEADPYTKGIELKEDGSVIVTYNTLDANGNRQFQQYDNVINWVNSITLSEEGEFEIIYNNDNISGGTYNTQIYWINKADILDDGTVKFLYNNGEVAYTREKYIKMLTEVTLEDKNSTGVEGSGDQKIHLTYNTGDEAILGSPINYVMESLITEYRTESSNTPAYHLIVLYSDPAYRASLKQAGKCVTYRSQKFTDSNNQGIMRDDWLDMGYLRGTPGGLHFIGDVESLDELRDDDGNDLAPEDIPGNGEEVAGWAYTLNGVEIYVYDYQVSTWYSIGSLDADGILPNRVIISSVAAGGDTATPPTIIDSLNNHGIWLVAEPIKYAL